MIITARSYVAPRFKFNPNHEPAGSPTGGQFASNATTVTITDRASAIAVDRARFQQEDEDIARMGGRALDAHQIIHYIAQDGVMQVGTEVCKVRMDKNGRVLSGIEYDFNEKGRLTVQLLGSLAKGEGTFWIRQMEGIAREKKLDVVLDALKKAVPFYEKMGFEKRRSGSRSLQRMIKNYDSIQMGKAEPAEEDDIGALAVNERVVGLLGGKELKFNPNHEPAGSPEGGQFTSGEGSSIFYEVAPDPNDAALTARWNKLTEAEKIQVSETVAGKIAPQVLDAVDLVGDAHAQIGGYEGATNPSFAIDIDPSGRDASKLVPTASLLGYALSQDSMMVVSAKPFSGSNPVGVVTVHLPKSSTMSQVASVYDHLWTLKEGDQHLVGGHSTSNGMMSILNFSSLSNEEFANRIDKHLEGKYNIDVHEAHVAFPQKADYGQNLPTGFALPSGSSSGTGRADRLRGEASSLIEEELTKRGKSWFASKFNPNHRPGGSPEGGQFAPSDGGAGNATQDRPEAELPRYAAHEPVPGAVSVVATHYGQAPGQVVGSSHYGQGLRGAERNRLAEPDADPRIRERIYFYVDEGHGIVPESGVGRRIGSVRLDNLYDPSKDKAALWGQGHGDANASEAAILNAGYDGYYVRNFANQASVAVLLGRHSVALAKGKTTRGLVQKADEPVLDPTKVIEGPTRYSGEYGDDPNNWSLGYREPPPAKYSPDQPRVPAGEPGGGEWVGDNPPVPPAEVKPDKKLPRRPATPEERQDALNRLASSMGLLVVTNPEQVDPEVREHLMLMSPEFSAETVAEINGMADAFTEVDKNWPGFSGLLQDTGTELVIGRAVFDSGAMISISGHSPPYIILNTTPLSATSVISSIRKEPRFTIGNQMGSQVLRNGGTEADAVRAMYRAATFHEIGHQVDHATGDALVSDMVRLTEKGAGEGATDSDLAKFSARKFGRYAGHNAKEATAEAFARILVGKKLAPEFSMFEKAVTRLGKEPYSPPKEWKFNPNHQPGGSPEGGQFAPAGGQANYGSLSKMPATIEGVSITKKNLKNNMLALGGTGGIAVNTSRTVAAVWKDMGTYMKKAFDSGWQSSSDENHVINHELAHVLVKNIASIDRQSYLTNLGGDKRFESMASKVSTYAKTNGHEFISEVFAGVRGGRTFGKDVMDYYKELGGPDPLKDHTPKPLPAHLVHP